MSRPFTPQVNNIVQYRKSNGSWVSAIVTAVTNAFIVDLRISHAYVVSAVSRMNTRTDVDVWDLSRLQSGVRGVVADATWGWWF